MARKKSPSGTPLSGSTRYKLQQRAKQLRPAVLKVRAKIPWVFGDNTYVYVAIAANGGVLRETDITASLGEAATRSLRQPDRDALGIIRRYQIRTTLGTGRRGYAVMFDETFPLAKEARALARTIGECHPLPVESKMPEETPPPPPPRKYNVDLIAGSEVNTLVLAATRVLRGKVTRSELLGAVPHPSYSAVERGIQRLIDYGILAVGGAGIYFADAPWTPQLERLYDAYLRLRPDIRSKVRANLKIKKQRRAARPEQNLLGFAVEERALQALAVNGPMRRTELASIATITRDEIMFKTLIKAGIVTTQEQLGAGGGGNRAKGARKRVVVSLNAAFPAYRELRALLLALADEPATKVQDLSDPRSSYQPEIIFNTPTLFHALTMMNAVRGAELDVASLNRLRSQHAPFTLHGRMRWLLDEGIANVRKSGHMLYYSLNPDYRAYKPLKRLLDKIGKIWPEIAEAAALNDGLKETRRRTEDRNAKKRGIRAKQRT